MCGFCTTLNTPAFLTCRLCLSLKIPATTTISCRMNLDISRGQASSRGLRFGFWERTRPCVLRQSGSDFRHLAEMLFQFKESRWRGANNSTRDACAPRQRGVTALPRVMRWTLRRRNVFAAVTQHARHPNQFIEEFGSPSHETFIEKPSIFAKNFRSMSKINVVENSDEPELAHHR